MEISIELATIVMLGALLFLMFIGQSLAFSTLSIAVVGALGRRLIITRSQQQRVVRQRGTSRDIGKFEGTTGASP